MVSLEMQWKACMAGLKCEAQGLSRLCAGLLVLLFVTGACGQPKPAAIKLVSVKKIWSKAPHNAFTDLIRFNDQWWCTFRESRAHVGGNGQIRLLFSKDGEAWESAALLGEEGVDLRDPKLSITPDHRLMLNLGGSVYADKVLKERQSRVAFSRDGTNWSAPERILDKGDWLWRITWKTGTAYGIAYRSGKPKSGEDRHTGMTARLVSSPDGVRYSTVTKLEVTGSPNESTLRFLESGDCVALVRREVGDKEAWIGLSHPPYDKWNWHSAGMRVGGPNFIVLNDHRMIAAGRQSSTNVAESKTFVGLMTLQSVQPELILPSGGDCSYPGLVWHDGLLWMSYYSSHQGKTDIYLAKMSISESAR